MKPIVYGSVCSGIEAATAAWHPLGWKPAFFSEIENHPRTLLKHHYPEVKLHGDFTTIQKDEYGPIDLLAGGTPCQDFSVAGLRKGLAGDRGNLTIEFVRLLERLLPTWFVFENVPGILSSDKGIAFRIFLSALGKCGYGFAYRILDAQYFGVPQRRRRMFVVGYLGNWRPAAAVLFESESLRGDPPPRREAGESVTHDIAPSIGASGRGFSRAGEPRGQDPVIAHALRAEGFDASEDGTGRGTPLTVWPCEIAPTLNAHFGDKMGLEDQHALNGGGMFVPYISPILDARSGLVNVFDCKGTEIGNSSDDVSPTLRSMNGKRINGGGHIAVTFAQNQVGEIREKPISGTVGTNSNASGRNAPLVYTNVAVRRLTPRECERLQGFPDDYTLVPLNKELDQKRKRKIRMMSDAARYKMIGNSMAMPVMHWIGQRIDLVRGLMEEE